MNYSSFLYKPNRLEFDHGSPRLGSDLANFLAGKHDRDDTHPLPIDLSSGDAPFNLIMCRHSTENIGDSLLQYINSPVVYGPQLEGLFLDSKMGPGQVIKDDDDIDEILAKHFEIFDRIFFMNALKNLCKIIIQPRREADGNGDKFKGLATTCCHGNKSEIPRDYACLIKITFPCDEEDEYEHGPNSYRPLLQTLLHEMLHAFLDIYSCRCIGCVEETERSVGHTGHGEVWLDVSLTIQDASIATWGFGNMNRAMGYAYEWVHTHPDDQSLPNEDDLRRWDLDSDNIRERISYLRSDLHPGVGDAKDRQP